jgi:flagellar basal-body rod protein FlgB
MTNSFVSFFSSGAIPFLERGLSFAAERHRLILDNVANVDTPGYLRKDLDPEAFRRALEAAGREEENGRQGMLRHDGNNVDLERELALLARNAIYHGEMAALLRKSFEQIRMAVAERPTVT